MAAAGLLPLQADARAVRHQEPPRRRLRPGRHGNRHSWQPQLALTADHDPQPPRLDRIVTRRLALVWLGAAALLAGCGGASPVPTSQQPTGPRATTKPSRTRATRAPLRPPFRTTWVVHAGSLIEFPPAILNARLFFGTNAGRFLAVSASTGEILWERKLGRCIAASPAVDRELVYVALMDPYPCATHDEQA